MTLTINRLTLEVSKSHLFVATPRVELFVSRDSGILVSRIPPRAAPDTLDLMPETVEA